MRHLLPITVTLCPLPFVAETGEIEIQCRNGVYDCECDWAPNSKVSQKYEATLTLKFVYARRYGRASLVDWSDGKTTIVDVSGKVVFEIGFDLRPITLAPVASPIVINPNRQFLPSFENTIIAD